jgi:hypothetical protein
MFPRQRIDGDIFSEKQLEDEFDGEPDEDLLLGQNFKLTGDMITADQIRMLWKAGLIDSDTYDCALPINTHAVCLDRGHSVTPHMREQARARCAEILNARKPQ